MATGGRYRNQADLITETLANLGVLAPGQPIDAEDSNYVSEKLDSIFRMLAALEICVVADANSIPGEWFSPLADIVAGECATKFGITGIDFTNLLKKGLGAPQPDGNGPGSGAAALTLKAIGRGRPTFERLRTEHF
jgi:hypothetical protein